MLKKKRWVWFAAAIVMFSLSACGNPPSPAVPTEPAAASGPVSVYGHAASDEESDIVYYIVIAKEQMSPLTSVQVTFTRDEPHEVWVDRTDGEQVSLGAFGAGTHVISLPDNITLLEMIVHDDEVDGLNMHIPEATLHSSAYTGRYLSVMGDSLSSSSIVESIADDAAGHNITAKWWYIAAKELGMNILVDATAGSTGIGIEAPEGAQNSGLHNCTRLHSKDRSPDYIFILLGLNDMFAGKKATEVELEYRSMAKQTKEAYPQADIILFTYPYVGDVAGGSNQTLEELVEQMNHIIRAVARDYSLDIIDLQECGITAQNVGEYIRSDNDFHYNRAGQELIGQQAIKGLKSKSQNR